MQSLLKLFYPIIFMSEEKTQKPVYIDGIGYVSTKRSRIPRVDLYSSLELMLYVQRMKKRIAASKQRTEIIFEAQRKYPELIKDMISGSNDVEVQADVIAWPDLSTWPDSNGNYSAHVKPEIPRGEDPVLLQEFTIEGNNSNYSLVGGTRTVLKNVPKSRGCLKKPIHELGLPVNAYLNVPEIRGVELTAVYRGLLIWSPERKLYDAGLVDLTKRYSHLACRTIAEKAD